jgi:transketolase
VGLPTSRAGASHNCIEDLAVMRALPNMRVADPGDASDLRAVMQTAMETPGPVYFRVTRLSMPNLFGPEHRFVWGKGLVIRPGRDVTLFGTGVMTALCLRAADLLVRQSIDAEVVHLASIKPIDRDLILESAARTGCAVTAENATIVGGFGAAVAEVLGDGCPVPLRRIGVRDRWVDSGGIGELFTHHGMQPEDIAAAACDALRARAERRR